MNGDGALIENRKGILTGKGTLTLKVGIVTLQTLKDAGFQVLFSGLGNLRFTIFKLKQLQCGYCNRGHPDKVSFSQ